MSTTHICSACRRNILVSLRRQGAGQLRSRSTFVSPNSTPSSTGDTGPEDILAIGGFRDLKNGQSKPKHAGLVRKTKGSHGRPDNVLDALFEETRMPPSTGGQLSDPTSQASVQALQRHIETLRGLLARPDQSIVDIWEYFTSRISSQVLSFNNPGGMPLRQQADFKAIMSALLHRLRKERIQSPDANGLPAVADLTSLYASMDFLHPTEWKTLVYDLLHTLSEQLASLRDRHGTSFSPELFREPLAISNDLIKTWNVLCKYYSGRLNNKHLGTKESLDDWKFLICPEVSDLTPAKLEGGLDEVFLLLWPSCPRPYVGSMTSAALITFALITDIIPQMFHHVGQDNPFFLAIARLLVATRCDVKDILKSQAAEDLANDFSIDWSSVLRRSEGIANSPTIRHQSIRYPVVRPLDSSSTLLSKKLIRAVAERDLQKIDDLWAEARHSSQVMTTASSESKHEDAGQPSVESRKAGPSVRETQVQMSNELCNQFILGYMGLRQPDRALGVWNYMIETSQPPSLSTWHALLEGCRKAKMATSLDVIWTRLRSSGLQPDVACWRTRISSLIERGKPELAIRALDEMGRTWREVAQKQHIKSKDVGEIDGIVKPTIETINDVISGLLNRGYHSAAQRILAWGDDFGIKADIVTFNILIRGMIREGRVQAVPPLLAEMQKQGIQADVATFTTILDEIFKTSHSLSSEEQLDLTNSIFTEMEAVGVRPNRFTYNKIISSLLQSESKDMKAVQAVLARMAIQKIEPSRDLYTMLVGHYFSQDPPNLEGVRSLLDRIRISGATPDLIFWDRVIEGYASVGDTSNALAVLGRVEKKGSMVGWMALEMVVRALAENREWEMARQVVRNVKIDRGGPLDIEQKGVAGQHSFWRAAGELGLMDSFTAD